MQGCRSWGWHPQILANQLTLPQPGARLLLDPPNPPRFLNIPKALQCILQHHNTITGAEDERSTMWGNPY